MKTVLLEIQDSKFEQFMTMRSLLRSDVVKKIQVQKKEEEFKIDEKHYLAVLDKINCGGYTGFEPIDDIDGCIVELKNAIS